MEAKISIFVATRHRYCRVPSASILLESRSVRIDALIAPHVIFRFFFFFTPKEKKKKSKKKITDEK